MSAEVATVKGHYLLLTFADGDAHVRREYVALTSVDEDPESAISRWVEKALAGRKRNRDKVAATLRGSILYHRFCRPSSWYRDQESAPKIATKTKRGKNS